ncbi:hypothetical protein F2P81_021738 [Scophthalmus maximus]|uniref:Uncharacterized protein n=1 Tax=Scophthalmus maximus TaxID=52904 RepID=A0A6A4S7C6_SCOMX|nr:hypothetical protein F2P81_021738 [Scophthalmus maximus]
MSAPSTGNKHHRSPDGPERRHGHAHNTSCRSDGPSRTRVRFGSDPPSDVRGEKRRRGQRERERERDCDRTSDRACLSQLESSYNITTHIRFVPFKTRV